MISRFLTLFAWMPVATASYHHWNFAVIGRIQFPDARLQLLTFHYGKGNNFACFEFERVDPGTKPQP